MCHLSKIDGRFRVNHGNMREKKVKSIMNIEKVVHIKCSTAVFSALNLKRKAHVMADWIECFLISLAGSSQVKSIYIYTKVDEAILAITVQ